MDRAAQGIFSLFAWALGYSFRVGADAELAREARSVQHAVWKAKGVQPPADVAWYGERYDRATTWLVAYHRGRAAGVMGIVDMRIASAALDYGRRIAPPDLPLDVTRELGRLAILPEHRGGAHVVMIGLLLHMFAWVQAQGIALLFAGSVPALYAVYRRYNPTARLVPTAIASSEDPVQARYFAPLRAYGGEDVVYTFEVAAGLPWGALRLFLAGLMGRKR